MYIICRVHCALGCVCILLTLLFCIVCFGLALGVSPLLILFHIAFYKGSYCVPQSSVITIDIIVYTVR